MANHQPMNKQGCHPTNAANLTGPELENGRACYCGVGGLFVPPATMHLELQDFEECGPTKIRH